MAKNETSGSSPSVNVKKGKNIHLVDESNDIRFHGFISYRHLRIAGWFFILLAQIGPLLTIISSMNKGANFGNASTYISLFGELMGPAFLLATFSQVLVAKDGFRKMITIYVGGAVAVILLYMFVYLHYLAGTVGSMSGDFPQASAALDQMIQNLAKNGFFTFNMFIDLALCALVTFFLNYRPQTAFWKKNIWLFRAFAALPIIYEVVSLIIKMLGTTGVINISIYLYPFLTTKPPLSFLLFITLVFFVKFREMYYLKKGKTYAEYDRFLDSNVNRWHFAKFLAFVVLVVSLLDLAITIALLWLRSNGFASGEAFDKAANEIVAWGFSKTVPMIVFFPFLFFYDYRKTYKKSMVDTLIPFAGIAAIALFYAIGVLEIIRANAGPLINSLFEGGDEPQQQSSGSIIGTAKTLLYCIRLW